GSCSPTLHNQAERSDGSCSPTLRDPPLSCSPTLHKEPKKAGSCSRRLQDSEDSYVIQRSPIESPQPQRALTLVRVVSESIPAGRTKPTGDAAFNAFYAAYPKHEGRDDALKEWRKQIKAGEDPA